MAKLNAIIFLTNEKVEIHVYLLCVSIKYITDVLANGVNIEMIFKINEISANVLLLILNATMNGDTICIANKKNNINSIIK